VTGGVQESRRGSRVCAQVRVTQASALKEHGCWLTCVFDIASQRLLDVELRGMSTEKTAEGGEYGKGLVVQLMELLRNAGDCLSKCDMCGCSDVQQPRQCRRLMQRALSGVLIEDEDEINDEGQKGAKNVEGAAQKELDWAAAGDADEDAGAENEHDAELADDEV